MVKVELGTFGAILKFALETEKEVNRFYESVINLVKDKNKITLYQDLLKRGEKRLKTLERVRRENVTEMILEPITGLDSENYKFETEIPKDAPEKEIQELAMKIEKGLLEFYIRAAEKIDFLVEAAYSFELLAEANENAIRSLS